MFKLMLNNLGTTFVKTAPESDIKHVIILIGSN